MKGLAGLKRGLGYFTSRVTTPIPDVSGVEAVDGPAWKTRKVRALGDHALSRELIRASEDVGGAASAVVTALARMQRDQAAHIEMVDAILVASGTEPPPPPLFTFPSGPALERSAQLILGRLCIEMSVKCDETAKARTAASGVEQQALDVLTRDQIAHADLGFLLWPIVRHTWSQERDDDPDAFARGIVKASLAEVPEPIRGRLERRFKGAGLEL